MTPLTAVASATRATANSPRTNGLIGQLKEALLEYRRDGDRMVERFLVSHGPPPFSPIQSDMFPVSYDRGARINLVPDCQNPGLLVVGLEFVDLYRGKKHSHKFFLAPEEVTRERFGTAGKDLKTLEDDLTRIFESFDRHVNQVLEHSSEPRETALGGVATLAPVDAEVILLEEDDLK